MMQTTHIRDMIGECAGHLNFLQDTVVLAETPGNEDYVDFTPGGKTDAALQGIINKLRHAAEELEAERLECVYGIRQI